MAPESPLKRSGRTIGAGDEDHDESHEYPDQKPLTETHGGRLVAYDAGVLGRSTIFAVSLFGVLAGLVVAGCGGSSTTTTVTSATASSADGSASGFTAIPTVKCKTVEGISRPAARLNATTPVPIPPSLRSKLAAYRNTGGTIVVAPVGFDCKGGIGVDGSEFVAAYPKDSPYAGESHGEPGTVVSLNIAMACQGCIAEAICTLFPEAKPVENYYGTIGGSKCPEKPLREEVSYPAKSTALFSDPPRHRKRPRFRRRRPVARGDQLLRTHRRSQAELHPATRRIRTLYGDRRRYLHRGSARLLSASPSDF